MQKSIVNELFLPLPTSPSRVTESVSLYNLRSCYRILVKFSLSVGREQTVELSSVIWFIIWSQIISLDQICFSCISLKFDVYVYLW